MKQKDKKKQAKQNGEIARKEAVRLDHKLKTSHRKKINESLEQYQGKSRKKTCGKKKIKFTGKEFILTTVGL